MDPPVVNGQGDRRADHSHGGTAARSGSPSTDRDGDGPSWAEALLEAEGPLLQMIGSGRPPGEVLEALCLMTEALCPGAT